MEIDVPVLDIWQEKESFFYDSTRSVVVPDATCVINETPSSYPCINENLHWFLSDTPVPHPEVMVTHTTHVTIRF